VSGYAPRAPGDSVRPRRFSAASGRPLNFTVRCREEAWSVTLWRIVRWIIYLRLDAVFGAGLRN
jgi:hypothetical protein